MVDALKFYTHYLNRFSKIYVISPINCGSLIKKISLAESDILCTSRTLIVPVKYRTAHDAMAICEELGERGIISQEFTGLIVYIQEASLHLLKQSRSMRYSTRKWLIILQCRSTAIMGGVLFTGSPILDGMIWMGKSM